MPRKPGSKNRAKRVEHQLLAHGGHQWRYSGKLYADRLEISKISGDFTIARLGDLNEAIKSECMRLGVPLHLNDPNISELMLRAFAVVAAAA